MSLTDILLLLEHYKYILIFPIRIFEGPIVTVISGFLVSLGFLNGPFTCVILIVADLIGDSFYYSIGRYLNYSPWARKVAFFLGFNERRELLIEDHFKKHKGKTLFIAKLAHGIGGMVQMASGIVKVSYLQFLWYNFLGSVPKTLAFLLIGFYVGGSYQKIDTYLAGVAFITISIVVVLITSYVLLDKISRSYFKNNE